MLNNLKRWLNRWPKVVMAIICSNFLNKISNEYNKHANS